MRNKKGNDEIIKDVLWEFVSDKDISKINKLIEERTENDMVNKPAHYTKGSIECKDAIKSALGKEQYEGFLRGNILKYIWRGHHKNENLKDYRKAQFWLSVLIEEIEEM
tara:strand:+ start:144 stop:470 length:327 start_codon:yes stop_codon:yes gene_type:complete